MKLLTCIKQMIKFFMPKKKYYNKEKYCILCGLLFPANV